MTDDDPYDRLGAGTDRDGDPFDRLADDRGTDGDGTDGSEPSPVDERTTDDDADGAVGTEKPGPGDANRETDTGSGEPGVPNSDGSETDATPGWLEQPQDADGVPTPDQSGAHGTVAEEFEDTDELFERMAVERIDGDAVWAQLGASQASADDQGDRDRATVSKHAFCEQCEHFSPPPEIECGHEGTAILEFPDMESVRVADCPVVAERRDLDDREQF
jgi:hypothetical protein